MPELFAVLRQWVPQVQKNIALIGNEVCVWLLQLLKNMHMTRTHAKIVLKNDPSHCACVCVRSFSISSWLGLACNIRLVFVLHILDSEERLWCQ